MRHLGLSRGIKLKEAKLVSRKRGIKVKGYSFNFPSFLCIVSPCTQTHPGMYWNKKIIIVRAQSNFVTKTLKELPSHMNVKIVM